MNAKFYYRHIERRSGRTGAIIKSPTLRRIRMRRQRIRTVVSGDRTFQIIWDGSIR